MDEQEAKKLTVGTRVYWGDDKEDSGTVSSIHIVGFSTDWDNGQYGTIAYRDAKDVHLLEAAK